MTPVAGYAWITLAVSDLERSVSWYRQVFGLDVLMTNADTCAVGTAEHFVYLIEPSSLFVLGLKHVAERDSAPFSSSNTGLAEVAIAVGSGRLSDHLAHLDDLGISYRGPSPWKMGTVAEISDPDGIPLRLFDPATSADRG
jgi:catechol 2,3-dioxygenase-like lactoylglutathione lyase family enzyme